MTGAAPTEPAALAVGDHVIDETDLEDADTSESLAALLEDVPTLVVVGVTPDRADEYTVEAGGNDGDGPTVAEFNPEYPPDDRVIEAVYPQPHDLDLGGCKRYAFPQSRLERVAPVHTEAMLDPRQADIEPDKGGERA